MSEKSGTPRCDGPPPAPTYVQTHSQRWRIVATVVFCSTLVWLTTQYDVFPCRTWPMYRPKGAENVLSQNPLIDGHNDLLIFIREFYNGSIYSDTFTEHFENGGMLGQFDLPRAEAGQLGGSFWSAFVPCPDDIWDFSNANYAPYVRATLEQIDMFNRLSEKYPDYFTLAATAKQAEQNWDDGKLISPLIIEGLHQIGNSLATLRLFHKLGVRYATLTWNCHNRYADAAVLTENGESYASKPYHGGVSAAGRDLILEMNRLGMMVDLSHVSDDTMRDVLRGTPEKGWNGSIAPPIFSHSSARAICPHPRNVPDDILHLVKKRKSVVMVNFAPDFISCKSSDAANGLPNYVNETNTLDQVVKHIMHIGELIGYEHVGIGSDYDGIPTTPRGLKDVSKFPALINALLMNGVSDEDAGKIAGRNILRVWHEVDKVAERLQKEMDPVEDELSPGFHEQFRDLEL